MTTDRTPPKKKAKELAKYLRAETTRLSISQKRLPRGTRRVRDSSSSTFNAVARGSDGGGNSSLLSGRVELSELR